MMKHSQHSTAISIAIPAAVRTPPSGGTDVQLFVSTSLQSWAPDKPHLFARDVQLDDVVFRRLDPEYFAWLRSRVQALKSAQAAGRLSQEAFNEIRTRFNAIQERAIAIFGEQALREAVRGLDLDGYRPPLPEAWDPIKVPAVSVQRSTESERLARARALVDEIRERALALGWKERWLSAGDCQSRNRVLAEVGLVCYIRQDHRIGEVTGQAIELIGPPPRETRTRFYNPDAEQPWIRKL